MKGEIVENTDDEKEPWYQFSATTSALMGGLFLLIGGCCLNQNMIDGLSRLVDFRLWPWWYFAALIVIVFFSVKWYILSQTWEDYDEEDIIVGRKFMTMSFTITGELLVLVLLKSIGFLGRFSYPLWRWFGFGEYSHMALLTFMLVCAAVVLTIYMIKEWYVVAFPS
jgi:hypothetical protein